MFEMYDLWIVIASLIVVKLSHWIYQWNNPKCSNGILPPGTMGFPIIGETFKFMKPHDALQFSTFLKERVRRYGPLFRTSLFGGKFILSMDNELNVEVAKKTQIPGYTKSIGRLFGENNLFVKSTESHRHVRNLTLKLLGSQGLKLRIIEDIALLARKHIEEGAKNGSLDVKETASKILVECLAKKVMGELEPEAAKRLAFCWRYFPSGWFRFAVNFPGMGIYNMMQARKRFMKLLKETVLKKRASGEEFGEFFKLIFAENEGGKESLSIEDAIEYIYTFFLIANEAAPRVLAGTVKLISENPKVKEELQREHDRIYAEKEGKVTWEDYKSMTFTNMVINESLRITSTVPVLLRKPDHDIQIGDYIIPAGWTFMGYASVHFNPEKYEDPFVFNPWRWQGKDLDAIVSKNYLPFGTGPRLCVGAYFAKMLMAIFIHHLFRYRWSMKPEVTLTRSFLLLFPRGCDVQISKDTKVDESVGY